MTSFFKVGLVYKHRAFDVVTLIFPLKCGAFPFLIVDDRVTHSELVMNSL